MFSNQSEHFRLFNTLWFHIKLQLIWILFVVQTHLTRNSNTKKHKGFAKCHKGETVAVKNGSTSQSEARISSVNGVHQVTSDRVSVNPPAGGEACITQHSELITQ